jgi:hypothetical protein
MLLAAQPIETASDLGTSMFLMLIVIAGSIAAVIFFAIPLRRRRARGSPPLGNDGPWSTGPADGAGSSQVTAQPSAKISKPWSTDKPTDDPLQRSR